MTDDFHPSSPSNDDPAFIWPKVKELCGLIYKGTFQVVRRKDIGPDANTMVVRLVLAVKNTETDNPVQKARFVVQGHTDK